MAQKTLVITGGLGYIGSHTCVELLDNYNLVVIDNLSNTKMNVVDNIKKIKKNLNSDNFVLYMIDLLDKSSLDDIFKKHKPYGVIHFAGLKSVSDSIKYPGLYYNTNLVSTLHLLDVMKKYNCNRLVFSSSATVYGDQPSPLKENSSTGIGITNPYGKTKFMLENILKDFCTANPRLNIIALRYFNPVGCHYSGVLGENPNDKPNNLMPILLRVATNNNSALNLGSEYDILNIFGSDYKTLDGTCERDFIHVVDLAKAHVSSIQYIDKLDGFTVFNVGTGKPTSILKLIDIFKTVNNVNLPYIIKDKRSGDIGSCYCDPGYIKSVLNWKPEKSVEDMCRDAWNYQVYNIENFIQ